MGNEKLVLCPFLPEFLEPKSLESAQKMGISVLSSAVMKMLQIKTQMTQIEF